MTPKSRYSATAEDMIRSHHCIIIIDEVRGLVEQSQNDRKSYSQEGRAGCQCGASVEDWHRGHGRGSRVLDQRGRADRGRRRVYRDRSHSGDGDGSGIGGREDDRDVGGGAGRREHQNLRGGRHHDHLSNDLRAGNSVMSIVGTSTELNSRTAGEAHNIASAGIVLAAHARATRAVGLAVSASAELDGRAVGEADVETGTGIVLTVTSGRSSVVGLATAQKREITLLCRS